MKKYRLSYDRVFATEPPFLHKGRNVVGASIKLLFRFYKNGEEVLFDKGEECSACDNVICSFDRYLCYRLHTKPIVKESWFDQMEFCVTEWYLLVERDSISAFTSDSQDDQDNVLECEALSVSHDEFCRVLREHWKCFDVPDNISAQSNTVWHDAPVLTNA